MGIAVREMKLLALNLKKFLLNNAKKNFVDAYTLMQQSSLSVLHIHRSFSCCSLASKIGSTLGFLCRLAFAMSVMSCGLKCFYS